MVKFVRNILYIGLALFALTSCSQEDDIEEIFVGRTWYMNGATINGMKLNSDISNFYTDAGENAYFITFSSGTFKGVLSAGANFSGKWEADGKHQSITMTLDNKPTNMTTFDSNIYHILTGITSYQSGADFLQLKQDAQNIVLFGSSRSMVYN